MEDWKIFNFSFIYVLWSNVFWHFSSFFPAFSRKVSISFFGYATFFFFLFWIQQLFFSLLLNKNKRNKQVKQLICFCFPQLVKSPNGTKEVTAKKQQQHKLEFQLGVLCIFFSVCWQHLKVFFQNILFLETKHGRKLKRVMTFCLLSKKRTASQHC